MNLYEIDGAILSLVDPETGEIMDVEAFESLSMERDRILENMALWYKDLVAEGEAIRKEENALAARRKTVEKNAERLKTILSKFLAGEKFKTPRVMCSFRESEAVEIENEAAFVAAQQLAGQWGYLTFLPPQADKAAIKTAIKQGVQIDGVRLVKRNNIQIK